MPSWIFAKQQQQKIETNLISTIWSPRSYSASHSSPAEMSERKQNEKKAIIQWLNQMISASLAPINSFFFFIVLLH